MVSQSHVDDTPFVRRHWFEGYWPTGICNALCDPPGHAHKRLISAVLITFHVNQHVDVSVQFLADQILDQELESLERVPAASNQKARVIAFDLEHRSSQVFPLDLSQRRHHLDAQKGDNVIDHFRCRFHNVRGCVDSRHSHPRRLAPYAQDAGLPSTNDVDFGLGAIYF